MRNRKRTAYGKMHVKFHYRKIYVLSQHERMGFIPAKGLMFNSSVRLLSTLSTTCTCRQTPIDTFHKVYLSAACCRRFQHRVLFYNVYMHCFPRIRQRVLFDTVYCFRQCLLVGSRCGDIKYPPKKFPGGWFRVGK